jgi:peptide/nickel transport system substrate-binding protein/oligopeptide transport system substrate-binding protein
MQVRRLATRTALATALTLGLAACSSGPGTAPGGGTTGVISIGISEPQHLIPTDTTDANGGQVLAALFTPLVVFDKTGKPVPEQAESITTSDSKAWMIRIKRGYTFHNGEPVTSDSYLRAWQFGAYGPNGQNANAFFAKIDGYAAMNPTDKKAPTAKTLSGLKKVDDYTLQVTLSAPYSEFSSLLGYTAFLPLPTTAFDATGRIARGFEDSIVGDGPFELRGAWAHDQSIQVQRYDKYPGDRPKIGKIDFKIYQDPTTAYSDVLTNTLDVLRAVPTANLGTAAADFSTRYQHSPSSAFAFLAFPTYDSDFADPRVRKAISMAIDRDQIVKTVFAGSQTSARSFVSPIVPGYRDNTCGDACKYDPGAAKELYKTAGGPTKVQITYNADGGHKDWVEATCNQLNRNLGVKCLAQAESKLADLLTKVRDKTPGVGMFRLGWVMDYPSMEDYLTPLYSTHGSSNYYGYSNPEFDKLVAQGATQPSADASLKIYQQAEDILARDLPVIPLRFSQNNFVFSTNVQNVTMDLYGYVNLTEITTSAG